MPSYHENLPGGEVAADKCQSCWSRLVAAADTGLNRCLVVAAIASALGLQEVPDRSLLEAVSAYLRRRTMLLFLDNCEHVIVGVGKVATALLSTCPHIHILATSREPLKAAGEYTYRLSSLSIASAVELFADRARASD